MSRLQRLTPLLIVALALTALAVPTPLAQAAHVAQATSTPTPTPQTYADVTLPHGTARVLFTLTFGEVAIVVVWLGILLTMLTAFVWERIEKWLLTTPTK